MTDGPFDAGAYEREGAVSSADAVDPAAVPAGADPAGGGEPPAGRSATAVGCGPNARRRPRPELAPLLGFLGGAFATFGLAAAIIGDVRTHAQLIVGLVGALLLVAGIGLGLVLPDALRTSAAVMASVGATMAVGAAVVHGDGRWLPVLLLLGIAAAHLALWALPGLRDRTFLFAVGVLAFQAALVATIAIATARTVVQDYFDDSDAIGDFGDRLQTSRNWTGATSCILGVVLLFGAVRLARSGRQGLATPFLFGGAIGGAGGALAVAGDGTWAPTLTTIACGAVLLYVGTDLGRRGTAWSGTVLAGVGFSAALGKLASAPRSLGALALGLGAALLVAALATSTVHGTDQRVEE